MLGHVLQPSLISQGWKYFYYLVLKQAPQLFDNATNSICELVVYF